ncbi:PIN domain protein [uncultured archaeon]|nr:PIN domain protein [uncultured archaeon]
MTKYLLDTCIWRDFYEGRISKTGTLLGKNATEFIIKLIKNEDTVLFSETLIRELRNHYDDNEIKDMLNLLFMNRILIRIEITKEDYQEARRISKQRNLPFVDCLNAIQTRNHKALLVTQDAHYFKNLSDIITPIRAK